jgi:hypothetical protein
MGSTGPSTSAEDNIHKTTTQDLYSVDIEQKAVEDAHLMNDTVKNFVWQGVTVKVKANKTKEPKAILDSVDGIVEAGKLSNPDLFQ